MHTAYFLFVLLVSLPHHKSCAVSMLQLMAMKVEHTTVKCPLVFVRISQLFQRLKRFTHKQHSDFKNKVCYQWGSNRSIIKDKPYNELCLLFCMVKKRGNQLHSPLPPHCLCVSSLLFSGTQKHCLLPIWKHQRLTTFVRHELQSLWRNFLALNFLQCWVKL